MSTIHVYMVHFRASVRPPYAWLLYRSTSSVHLLILPSFPACLDWWWQVLPSWRAGTTRWVPCTEGGEPAVGSERWELLWNFHSSSGKFPYLNSSRLQGTLTTVSSQALRVALSEWSGVHHVTWHRSWKWCHHMHINVSHLHVHIPRNVTSILHEQ